MGTETHGVLQATDLEVNMNAVERMVEYTSQEPEGAAQGTSRAPSSNWPQAGAITVNNLQVCSSAACQCDVCCVV